MLRKATRQLVLDAVAVIGEHGDVLERPPEQGCDHVLGQARCLVLATGLFGRPWSRITQQILPAFSDAVVAQAREKAKALERQPYLPPEVRT